MQFEFEPHQPLHGGARAYAVRHNSRCLLSTPCSLELRTTALALWTRHDLRTHSSLCATSSGAEKLVELKGGAAPSRVCHAAACISDSRWQLR